MQKWLKTKAKSKEIKRVEKGEQGEGVAHALAAGRGDVVKGVRKLGLEKPGLKGELRKAKCPAGVKPPMWRGKKR